MAVEDVVGGDEAQNERAPLVQCEPPIYLNFRHGREPQRASRCMGFILTVFKVTFCSLGLWGHRAWNYIPRVLFVVLCALQAANQMSADFNCRFFDCSFYQNFNLINVTLLNGDLLESAVACFTLYCLANTISYLVFIGCLFVSRRKDSTVMSPSISMMEDVDKTEIFVLFFAFVIIMVLISMALVLLYSVYYQIFNTPDFIYHGTMITEAILLILVSWASINPCHVFAISSFTLGTFAQDTFRLIREVQNGTLDDVIRIHEDLCTVVFNTVSAYSVWFVLHWFTYGAGVVVNIVFISKEFVDNNQTPEAKAYICCVLACCLYVFALPCFCAARITSKCAGVYEKINCTTSEDWNAGHPFRDRHNIALFISYAKDRRCGFKVGRITFDSSLAWLSFFFGLTALLFQFF